MTASTLSARSDVRTALLRRCRSERELNLTRADVHRPSNLSLRHFAYPPSASLDDLTAPTAIDASLDPPDAALSLAAPAFGDMLNEKVKPHDLAFARGKSVWFIGDSCVQALPDLVAARMD